MMVMAQLFDDETDFSLPLPPFKSTVEGEAQTLESDLALVSNALATT